MNFRLIFIFFLLQYIIPATAQNVVIKSCKITTDHIPADMRRNDFNNKPCALVKVQVLDEIARVEGNKIGKIVDNGGAEKLVYMCQGTRSMRIHLKKHLPVNIVFQEHSISSLEGNRVYEIILEETKSPSNSGGQVVSTPTPTTVVHEQNTLQKFILNYSPANATVIIDSKMVSGDGRIEMELPVGEHNYVIAAEGYIAVEGTVKLNEYSPRTITEELVKDNNSKNNKPKTSAKEKKAKENIKEKTQGLRAAENTPQSPARQSSNTNRTTEISVVKDNTTGANQKEQTIGQKINRFFDKVFKNDLDYVIFRDGRMQSVKILQIDNEKTLVMESGANSASEHYIMNSGFFMLKSNTRGNIVFNRVGERILTTSEPVDVPKGAISIICVDGREIVGYNVRVKDDNVTYNTAKKGKGQQLSLPVTEVFLINYSNGSRDVLTSIIEQDRREQAAEEARIEAERKVHEAEIARIRELQESMRAEAAKPTMKNPKLATIVTKKGVRMKVWVCEDTPTIVSYKKAKTAKSPVIKLKKSNIKSITY